ncbi:hypothetical protein RSAG8_10802, partial [Rhizoctonia solani AG-8 WAC10335]
MELCLCIPKCPSASIHPPDHLRAPPASLNHAQPFEMPPDKLRTQPRLVWKIEMGEEEWRNGGPKLSISPLTHFIQVATPRSVPGPSITPCAEMAVFQINGLCRCIAVLCIYCVNILCATASQMQLD